MTAITSEAYRAMEVAYSAASTGTVVVSIDSLQEWQFRVIEQITTLRDLPANWDSYGAPSISDAVLERAMELTAVAGLPNVPPPIVLPLSTGGIQLSWEIGQREVDFEIGPDLLASVIFSENDRELADFSSFQPSVHAVAQVLAWTKGD